MEKLLKYFVAPALTLLILSVVIYFFFKSIIGTSVPKYEGEIEIKGLADNVEIRTNDYGIPLVKSKSRKDLLFALGYLHARDRLLEMEYHRLIASGGLSEYLGEKTVETDKFFRQLDLSSKARTFFEELDSEAKVLVKAYSDGINGYLNSENPVIQSEFSALGIAPHRWSPEDIVLLTLLNNFSDESKYFSKRIVGMVRGKIEFAKAAAVFGTDTDSISKEAWSKDEEELLKREIDIRELTGLRADNSLTVSEIQGYDGVFATLNGRYTFPGKYYQVFYESEGISGSGVTIPGVPVLYLGMKKNEFWVLNSVSKYNPVKNLIFLDDKGGMYVENKKRGEIKIKKDTILIKNREPLILETKTAPGAGAIISLPEKKEFYNNDSTEVLNLFSAIAINHSGFDAADFLTTGLKLWSEPVSSKYFSLQANTDIFVKTGDKPAVRIAARAVVKENQDSPAPKGKRTPRKKETQKPKPVETDDQPESSDSESLTITDFVKPAESEFFDLPSDSRNRFYLAKPDGKELNSYFLNDVTSDFSLKLVPFILNAFNNEEKKDTILNQSLKVLSRWSGEYQSSLQAPLIIATFMKFFTVNTFGDDLDKTDFEFLFGWGGLPFARLNKLLEENYSPVFDNINTRELESRDEIIRRSFRSALEEIRRKYDENLVMWLWGRYNTIRPSHIVTNFLGGINNAIAIEPAGISGYTDTRFRVNYNPFTELKSGRNVRESGTLYRFFARPSEGRLIFVPYLGNSGNFADKMSVVTYLNFLEGKFIDGATMYGNNDKVLRLIKKL
ncbi:MAG: penicillin acylase family protein [Bacteroidetes bacterium]|nr:penicillin acylase family protein [Bacteroidota bacterium]